MDCEPKGTWAEVVGNRDLPNGRDERAQGFPVPGREFKEETCRGTSLSRSLTMLAAALAFGLGSRPMSTRADGLTNASNTSNTRP